MPTECDASNNDIYRGDIPAMLAARDKVCEEFNKNRNVKSNASITELLNQGIQYCFYQLSFVILQLGRQVQEILDKSVVQIKKTEEDKFQMNIRDETHMFDNNPFRYLFIHCLCLSTQYKASILFFKAIFSYNETNRMCSAWEDFWFVLRLV